MLSWEVHPAINVHFCGAVLSKDDDKEVSSSNIIRSKIDIMLVSIYNSCLKWERNLIQRKTLLGSPESSQFST